MPCLLSRKKMEKTKDPKERYDICKSCEYLFKLTKQCEKCGCVMPLKVQIEEASCPMGKW